MRKSISMFFVLLALLSLGAVASAQMDDDHDHEVFCGTLSEEDCELYESLDYTPVSSAAFNMAVEGGVTTEGTTFDAAFNVSGSFIYNLDEYNAYLDSIMDVTLLEFSVDTLLSWFEAGIDAFDADLSITIEPSMLSVFSPIEGVDLWLVDGVGYIDLTPFGELAADESLSGVYGVDPLGLVRLGLESTTIGELFEDAEMMSEDDDFDFDFDGEEFEQFQEQFQNRMMDTHMDDPEFLGEFVMLERLEDSTVDGVDVAVFQTTVDVVALFESEEIIEQIEANVPEEDLEGFTIEEIVGALQEGLAGSTFVVTESYGLEDGLMYATVMDVALVIDPAPFVALDPTLADETAETFEFTMLIDLSRSDLNAVEAVALPADAVALSAEELRDMMR